jgi:hypothetical protein
VARNLRVSGPAPSHYAAPFPGTPVLASSPPRTQFSSLLPLLAWPPSPQSFPSCPLHARAARVTISPKMCKLRPCVEDSLVLPGKSASPNCRWEAFLGDLAARLRIRIHFPRRHGGRKSKRRRRGKLEVGMGGREGMTECWDAGDGDRGGATSTQRFRRLSSTF